MHTELFITRSYSFALLLLTYLHATLSTSPNSRKSGIADSNQISSNQLTKNLSAQASNEGYNMNNGKDKIAHSNNVYAQSIHQSGAQGAHLLNPDQGESKDSTQKFVPSSSGEDIQFKYAIYSNNDDAFYVNKDSASGVRAIGLARTVVTHGNADHCLAFKQVLANQPFLAMPAIPVEVNVEISIEKIYTISQESTLDLFIYVEARWLDERVASFFQNVSSHKCPHLQHEFMLGAHELKDLLWMPRFNFFASEKVWISHLPEEHNYVSGKSSGQMSSLTKTLQTIPCYDDLRLFPMDKPKCQFILSAFERDNRFVKLNWINQSNPIFLLYGNKTTEYTINNISKQLNTHNLPDSVIQLEFLSVEIVLHRHIGWYIIHGYIPAYLIILVSCLYTLLGVETRASRIQLRASLLMSLILMIYHMLRHMPRVGYVNALDVFTLMTLGFLVLSSMEDTLVAWLCNKQLLLEAEALAALRFDSSEFSKRYEKFTPKSVNRHKHKATMPLNQSISPIGIERFALSWIPSPLRFSRRMRSYLENHKDYRALAQTIDNWWLILYSLTYVLANVIYWIYYYSTAG